MLVAFFQFLLSGLSVGAAYALAGLGFTLIYNASGVINFAQGEFIMLGGMLSFFLSKLGLSLPAAIAAAIVLTILVGVLIEFIAIEPAKNADVTSLIIITIGASLIVRGLAQATLGSGIYRLSSFSGDRPISASGVMILPQSLWVFGVTILALVALAIFFGRSRMGKAMLATSYNRLAAMLMGINVRIILMLSFGMSAMLGALGGALLAPITFTSYDAGVLLGMKGFVGAVLGGLGRPAGAVVGGLLVGLAEILSAAYLSSAYKDAVPFLIILLVLFFRPTGLFGTRSTERV
jgi:branched-chain amino acid transport system permease protein